MSPYPAYQGMTFDDLRPGMIFIDAANHKRRVVVLKIYQPRMQAWLVTVGSIRGPYPVGSSAPFYWSPITPHRKWRHSGYYLDLDIPGNSPEDWQKVPLT